MHVLAVVLQEEFNRDVGPEFFQQQLENIASGKSAHGDLNTAASIGKVPAKRGVYFGHCWACLENLRGCSENCVIVTFLDLQMPCAGLLTPRQPLDYLMLLCGVKRPAHGAVV